MDKQRGTTDSKNDDDPAKRITSMEGEDCASARDEIILISIAAARRGRRRRSIGSRDGSSVGDTM